MTRAYVPDWLLLLVTLGTAYATVNLAIKARRWLRTRRPLPWWHACRTRYGLFLATIGMTVPMASIWPWTAPLSFLIILYQSWSLLRDHGSELADVSNELTRRASTWLNSHISNKLLNTHMQITDTERSL
jgi:hypothetical protein